MDIMINGAERAKTTRGRDMEEKSRVEEILRKREKAVGAKFERMERFDARITEDQFNYLKKTARMIMKSRSGEKLERITANSILRTAIELFRELGVELKDRDIPTEQAILSRARHKLYELEQGNK